jgi:hypothetical protein
MATPEESIKEGKPGDEYIDVTAGRGHTRIHISTGRVIFSNFMGGLAWGFGTALGATVVLGLVIIILGKLSSVPLIGDFITHILQTIQHPVTR